MAAIAAQTPLATYAPMVTPVTGTPDTCAVRTLWPIAYNQRPASERLNPTWISDAVAVAIARAIQTLLPSWMNAAGRPPMFLDCVSQIAKPLKNIIVVSVTMNAGIRSRAIAKPLSEPSAAPSSSIVTTAAGVAGSAPASQPLVAFMIIAPTTLANAIIDVTDRSMPPAISTMV